MNTKTRRIAFIIIALAAMLLLFISCEEPKAEFTGKYRTPTIAGTVSLPDSSGLSLSDIWVKVIDSNGQTKNVSRVATDGSFAVSGLSENEKYDVYFSSEEPDFNNYNDKGIESKAPGESKGFGGWLGQVDAAVNDGNNVGSVKMKPLGTIRGKAMYKGLDEHYDIDVYIPGTSYIAKTAEDGSWSIFNVPQGTYKLRMTSSGYIAQMMENVNLFGPENDYETNPVLVVQNTELIKNVGSVSGYASLSGAISSEGISILLTKEDLTRSYSTVTSKDGSYIISDVEPGSYSLSASSAGYISSEAIAIEVKAAQDTGVGRIELIANGGSLSGHVKDGNGAAIENVSILIKSEDDRYRYSTVTDSEGKYLFNNVYPGIYTISASKTFYDTADGTECEIRAGFETSANEICLSSSYGTISGKVIMNGSDDNSGVQVVAKGEKTYYALSLADGTFTLGNLKPGEYTVTYSKAGYVTHVEEGVNVEAGANTLVGEVSMISNHGSISGRVALEGETDYSAIAVIATLTDDAAKSFSVLTGKDGSYYISGLDAGQYSMQISKDGFISDMSKLVTVENGMVSVIDAVTLKSTTSRVAGTATLDGANDHTGITVLLKAADDSVQYSTSTDQNGNYVFNRVLTGSYVLYASKAGYETRTSYDIVVKPSVEKTLDSQSLAVAIRSISGSVALEGKSDHSGALITATNTSDGTLIYSAISNSDGNYVLAGMVPGEYIISISSAAYNAIALPTVNVVANSTASLGEAELLLARGLITGIAKLEGRADSSGIKVELVGTEYSTDVSVHQN